MGEYRSVVINVYNLENDVKAVENKGVITNKLFLLYIIIIYFNITNILLYISYNNYYNIL